MLQEAIEKNKKIKIIAYSVSESVEHRVKDVLQLIFNKYKKTDLIPAVYTCIKELLINAVKANFKNIYFLDYSSRNKSESIIEYELALKLFKLEISRENARYLEKLARKCNMRAEVMLYAENDKLNVFVMNPVEMTNREKKMFNINLNVRKRIMILLNIFLKMLIIQKLLMKEPASELL